MSQGMDFTKTQYGSESSAYGTEAGTYTELGRVQNINIDPTNNILYGRGLGEGINAKNAYYGTYDATGSVTFDVVDFDFLKHWIGPKTGAGTSGDKYTLTEADTIAVSGSTALVPFSIEYLNDDTSNQATVGLGCVGTDFTLSGQIGSKLQCSANFACQKTLERESGQTYTPITDPAFVMLNGTWKFDTTPSTLSGVRSFSISMANNLVLDTYSIESRFRGIPRYGQRVYNFTLSVIMAQALGDQVITYFYGKESPTNTYTPEDGSTSIGPSSNVEFSVDLVNGNKYATLHLDYCVIDSYTKPTELGGGLVLITFNGTALLGKNNAPIQWWTV